MINYLEYYYNDLELLNLNLSNKQDKLNNGEDVFLGGISSTNVSTTTFTNITINSINPYTLLHICTSYYIYGRPNYGGITLSVAQLKNHHTDPIVLQEYNGKYHFSIKYVNHTTLAVKYTGTPVPNSCLSIHAIL